MIIFNPLKILNSFLGTSDLIIKLFLVHMMEVNVPVVHSVWLIAL